MCCVGPCGMGVGGINGAEELPSHCPVLLVLGEDVVPWGDAQLWERCYSRYGDSESWGMTKCPRGQDTAGS